MSARTKVLMPDLYRKMEEGVPITMITCYDYSMADKVERSGMDIVLVGDSLGMTMLGYKTTLPVTMEDMMRHTAAVRRGAPNVFLVGDMPYMSYQASVTEAVHNAGRFMAECACDAIKLEGGAEMAEQIAAISAAGIPVMGHLGVTPQSLAMLGGYKSQGKDAARAKKIIDDAKAIEEAGIKLLLLESVPNRVTAIISERANIPVISLGSGAEAHGHMFIFHDMFGLYPDFKPKFAKMYGDAGQMILDGLTAFVGEVQTHTYPQREHWFIIKDEEYDQLLGLLGDGE